jgi:hypothetical protein
LINKWKKKVGVLGAAASEAAAQKERGRERKRGPG